MRRRVRVSPARPGGAEPRGLAASGGAFLGVGLAGRGAVTLGAKSRKQSRGRGGRAEPLSWVLFPKAVGWSPPEAPAWAVLPPCSGASGWAGGAFSWGGEGAWYPALPLGAGVEDVNSSPLSGWRSVQPAGSAHLLPSFRAGSCLYSRGSLLAENNKVWYA